MNNIRIPNGNYHFSGYREFCYPEDSNLSYEYGVDIILNGSHFVLAIGDGADYGWESGSARKVEPINLPNSIIQVDKEVSVKTIYEENKETLLIKDDKKILIKFELTYEDYCYSCGSKSAKLNLNM